MRVAVALVAVVVSFAMVAEADARARGGGLFKGSRSTPAASRPAAQPASTPRVGVGVGVVVPVGVGRSGRDSARPGYALPLPPRPAEEADAPKFHSASAEGPQAPAEKKPWCQDGQVVGRGAGFCMVGLKAEATGAPALLALSH